MGLYSSLEMIGRGVGLLVLHVAGKLVPTGLPHLVASTSTLVLVAAVVVARFPETSGLELEVTAA